MNNQELLKWTLVGFRKLICWSLWIAAFQNSYFLVAGTLSVGWNFFQSSLICKMKNNVNLSPRFFGINIIIVHVSVLCNYRNDIKSHFAFFPMMDASCFILSRTSCRCFGSACHKWFVFAHLGMSCTSQNVFSYVCTVVLIFLWLCFSLRLLFKRCSCYLQNVLRGGMLSEGCYNRLRVHVDISGWWWESHWLSNTLKKCL